VAIEVAVQGQRAVHRRGRADQDDLRDPPSSVRVRIGRDLLAARRVPDEADLVKVQALDEGP
jgi:hypothetical protein